MKYLISIIIASLLLAMSCRTPQETIPVVTSSSEGDSTFISCSRTISVMSETEFIVTLTISSSQLTGKAVINEQIPIGCKAKSIDSESALFDFDENKVQIVWVDFPDKGELKISYLVIVDSTVAGLQDITGEVLVMDQSCQIPAVALDFDEHSIMVQEVNDPTYATLEDISEQKGMIMGDWLLVKVKGDESFKYSNDDRYLINFRNDNKIAFGTNANNCTAIYSLNSNENITIKDISCTKVCCDEEPISYPTGLGKVTYYHVNKNKLILQSVDYQYEFERY